MTDISFFTRRLTPADAEAYFQVRREALHTEPLAFGASPEDDRDLPTLRSVLQVDSPVAVFGAYSTNGESLLGIAGLHRSSGRKTAHKVYLWGFYVREAHRSRGIGGALLNVALEHARQMPGVMQVQLTVSDRAPAAQRLYQRLGFVRWGTEPRALVWEGEAASEDYMALML